MTSEIDPMRRRPIEPWRPARMPSPHDGAYLDRFVDGALRVLARTGMKVLSDRAVEVFREHGAAFEVERSVVRLPERLVRGALACAPRSFILGSRDGSCDIDLASGSTYMTADGCGTEVIDWRTGARRGSTKADLADATRLLDYVSSIGFWWPTVGAGDCGETAPLHELEAGWNNTVKHLQGMVQGERQARSAVAMATVIAGGGEALRRRPPLSNLICAVSPLTIDRDGADAALVFAEAGVPVALCSVPVGGTTAPATPAGALVQALAEVLALVALVQLASPGAPVIAYPAVFTADPRTGGMATSIDERDPALSVALVHRLGLPSLHAVGGTETDLPGTWAAAAEAGPSLAAAARSGSELCVGIGLTNGGMLWSAESLILDDFFYHQARYAVMERAADDEALALDVIDAVGPGGHFLGHQHTRRHFKTSFVRGVTAELGDRGAYRDAVEVARERALDILEHYTPETLDAAKAADLRRIITAADEAHPR
jgi:trimethylamine--corrinoid protein Co-methyltransferase